MKKVLIVDDQPLNQSLLQYHLEEYCQQNDEPMIISTANNGVEALLMCEETPYDLIFMDIIMPSMDGIEATKRISTILPHAIIVIVSTEGDEENQIKALRNGAKDYSVKPIQPDLFKRRVKLYLNMLSVQKGLPSSKKAHNLFTNNIFCYKTTYLIENEEDLSQLWESLMFNVGESVQTNHLSDLIRFIYQMCLSILVKKVQPQIIIEENEHDFFFSILNIKILGTQKIEQLIKGYFRSASYRIESNILSFKMAKISQDHPFSIQYGEPDDEKVNTVVQQQIPVSQPPLYESDTAPLQTFGFMEEEDIISLELRFNELANQFMWMGTNELDHDDVDQIINAFEKISTILNFYTETQVIGSAIHDLSELIKNDEAVFLEKAPQMTTLCRSFNSDMILWYRTIFFDGAPSVNYMDASILSNIQMIRSFLQPSEEMVEEIEFF